MIQIVRIFCANLICVFQVFVAASFLALFGFYSATAYADSYLVHTGPNGYPPFLFVDERADGVRYTGIIVDLLEEFEKHYPEFNHRYNSMSRTRANLYIARGEFSDLMFFSPTFASPETLETYKFTRILFKSKDVVVTRREDDFVYKKPEDLYGKSVAVIRGYSYFEFDELFQKEIVTAVPVNLHVQAIGMLSKKRADAYFGNMLVTPFYLKDMGLEKSEFTFSESPLHELSFAFMVHRDKEKLYNSLNEFILKAKLNGVFDDIVNKYLN